ncbi:single-stranded DNA-binding protein, mitochondrial [Lutzomyia longipalpis]|uniref:single-stranded DNA-binding protein, mitochondrial n=1 Tax=Lutzomyia longipalpis TaxID=7200 RepID=UPI0024845949|nr:single-stranded DNA-binding protein, mitochondrial [Lutzomyia longipalpis]
MFSLRSQVFRGCLARNAPGFRFFADKKPETFEKTVNNVTLLGRVGVEPQIRGTEEHPVVTFSLATHENYKYESGDWSQKTDWHRIVVFKPNLRESVMNYLRRGQRTMVQGRISYGEITDQEGKQRVSTSIIADDVIFINTSGK